jgi:anti-sigma-K factor RskA
LGVELYNTSQSNLTQIAELNQKLVTAEQQLNEAQTQLMRERQERELLGSPASAVFSLTGTEDVPGAKARLVFDQKTGKAVLFVEGLPDAPQGKAYQIWWITDPKKPAPGGTFKTGAEGKGELRDQIPQQYTKASFFAVTVEPEGGSQSPTGSIILKSPV